MKGAAGAVIAVSPALPLWGAVLIFLILAGVVAYGWPRLLDLPSPRGTTSVLGLTSIVLAAVMLGSSAGHRTRWAGAVLCLGLIGSFLHQLLRQDGRPRLVMSLAGTALGLGFLGAGSYLIPDHDSSNARHALVAVGAAVVLGALVDGRLGASSRRIEFAAVQVGLGGFAGLLAVIAGSGWLVALATGALSGLFSWAALRTTVTRAASAHTRAQLAAGCSVALLCCFVPFALTQLG